jgi:CRP-like cAMP-binding protein
VSALPADVLAKLAHRSVQTVYWKGQYVCAPSPRPRTLFLLERGRVRLFRLSPQGAESTLFYVRPGEFFGESAALGGPRADFADVAMPSTVWAIDAKVFIDVVLSQAESALTFAQQIHARLLRAQDRIEDSVFRDARARVAGGVLRLAFDFGSHDPLAPVVIDFGMTQAELGILVGLSRQEVNRRLCQLQDEGLIRLAKRRILVLDRAGLERAAQV